MQTIELGHGDTLITDIFNKDEGWAGICLSDGRCEVGEFADTDAKTDEELGAYLRIITSNQRSLEVIIEACKRAITHLKNQQAKT